MRAAVYQGIGELEVQTIPDPVPGPGELLLRMRAVGICGSDVRTFRYGNKRVRPPQVIGHEGAGEVAAVGEGVTHFQVGQRVALGGDVPCGECRWCRAGMANNCEQNYAIGYQFPGCLAEYLLLNRLVVEQGPVCPVPEGMNEEEAALAEPLACCLNGLEISGVNPGDVVCIIGAGPIGCMLTWAAHSLGAGKVILTQRSRSRLQAAALAGPDVLICTGEEDPVDRVLQETEGLGADLVLTAAPSAEAQAQALRMVRTRGRVNFFAGLPISQGAVSLDTNIIHYRECTVQGSHGATPRHHRAAVGMIARGTIPVRSLISHRFPLEDAREAILASEDRRGMKVMVSMGDG